MSGVSLTRLLPVAIMIAAVIIHVDTGIRQTTRKTRLFTHARTHAHIKKHTVTWVLRWHIHRDTHQDISSHGCYTTIAVRGCGLGTEFLNLPSRANIILFENTYARMHTLFVVLVPPLSLSLPHTHPWKRAMQCLRWHCSRPCRSRQPKFHHGLSRD